MREFLLHRFHNKREVVFRLQLLTTVGVVVNNETPSDDVRLLVLPTLVAFDAISLVPLGVWKVPSKPRIERTTSYHDRQRESRLCQRAFHVVLVIVEFMMRSRTVPGTGFGWLRYKSTILTANLFDSWAF